MPRTLARGSIALFLSLALLATVASAADPAPLTDEVVARAGGVVVGICNGFQILCEAGLLPGALLRNDSLQYRCRWVHLRAENLETPFTRTLRPGQIRGEPWLARALVTEIVGLARSLGLEKVEAEFIGGQEGAIKMFALLGEHREIADALKKAVEEAGLKGKIRVTKTLCLGFCEQGPNVMIFPEGKLLSGVRPEDVPAMPRTDGQSNTLRLDM